MKSYDTVAVDSFRRMADYHNGGRGGGQFLVGVGAVWSEHRNPVSDQNLWFNYPFSDFRAEK